MLKTIVHPRPSSSQLPLTPSFQVHCVKGEIHNVLYVMRLNRRWASEARFKVEIPLQVGVRLSRLTAPR